MGGRRSKVEEQKMISPPKNNPTQDTKTVIQEQKEVVDRDSISSVKMAH